MTLSYRSTVRTGVKDFQSYTDKSKTQQSFLEQVHEDHMWCFCWRTSSDHNTMSEHGRPQVCYRDTARSEVMERQQDIVNVAYSVTRNRNNVLIIRARDWRNWARRMEDDAKPGRGGRWLSLKRNYGRCVERQRFKLRMMGSLDWHSSKLRPKQAMSIFIFTADVSLNTKSFLTHECDEKSNNPSLKSNSNGKWFKACQLWQHYVILGKRRNNNTVS